MIGSTVNIPLKNLNTVWRALEMALIVKFMSFKTGLRILLYLILLRIKIQHLQ